jgi:hypothetical protein
MARAKGMALGHRIFKVASGWDMRKAETPCKVNLKGQNAEKENPNQGFWDPNRIISVA